ncbi:hypothetical protein EVJ58_g4547 [Rhodofomes roseus]|uniref:GED domain-containing protein n=1 Tax=Rhodofomes roseus TaxID=34475 RepID=A0A4Y9YFP7_9APHY|nr:hypothetical protein EVJ58_g4547 [Rhodofomes roseus]
MKDRRGNPDFRTVPFGNPITNSEEVAERIHLAQHAILNPSTQASFFLSGGEPSTPETTFSSNCVSLEISGPDIVDLYFVDLPGLIVSAGSGSTSTDIELVRQLVTEYAEKEDCIMLVTVTCETEFENQGAYQLARTFDPTGRRTIGVLTKPDRIGRGEEERWIHLLKNELPSLALANGWFSVKQPDNVELKKGITRQQAQQQEKDFFANTRPWDQLPPDFRQRLGTPNLMERCSDVLCRLIAKRLPEIQAMIQEKLRTAENQLEELPQEPADPVGEVNRLISELCSTLSRYVEGTPGADGLLQMIRPKKTDFMYAIRTTAPDFRPYEKSGGDGLLSGPLSLPNFLVNEEEPSLPQNDSFAIYIDEVKEVADTSVTRELPDHIPFIATELFIRRAVSLWRTPAMHLFDYVENVLNTRIAEFIHAQCKDYPELDYQVSTVVSDFMNCRSEATKERIRWLLDLEERPRIVNDYQYRDYRTKFLIWYKSHRSQFHNIPLLHKLQQHIPDAASGLDEKLRIVAEAFGALDDSLREFSPVNLVKVLRTDPYDSALDIMASVRAYFQIAYKRFVDNVPNAIDHELVLGLNRGHALEMVLRKELGLSGPSVEHLCADYLREDEDTAVRRADSMNSIERLKRAKGELTRVRM